MNFQNINIVEIAAIAMFFIGFYGLITKKNIIKSIAAIIVIEIAVVVFYLSLNFRPGVSPPIGTELLNVADPLPQALVITAIIIGVTVSAVNLTMLVSLYRQSGTTDWDTVFSKKHKISGDEHYYDDDLDEEGY